MIPEVYPISIPSIDWNILFRQSREALGRSLSRSIDQHGINVKAQPFRAYIAALAAMTDAESDASQILRKCPRSVLMHLSFGFLIRADDRNMIEANRISSGLKGIISDDCMILTGTLNDWVVSLSDLRYETIDLETRAIFNIIFLLFEQLGLRDLWSDFRKVELPHSTFKLVKHARS